MARSKYALHLPALTEYRAATAKRRAEAFCDVQEYVLGSRVKPLTAASFSMLYASHSAFVMGGPVRVEDVLNYLWLHSRLHTHTGGFLAKRRKKWALRRFVFEMTQPWMKWIGRPADMDRSRAALNIAIAQIRRIIEDAFADAPARTKKAGKPLATLEAFFLHEFATAYNWTPERTRETPLRQLMQLHRCIRASRGDEMTDDGEDRIIAEHHERMQAQYDAEQKEAANV